MYRLIIDVLIYEQAGHVFNDIHNRGQILYGSF